MSIKYSKNVLIASGNVLGGFEEGRVNADCYSGQVMARQADGSFTAGNKGELFVSMPRIGAAGIDVGHNAGDVAQFCPIQKPLVLNLIMEKGLDVKPSYAMYINNEGLVTNVAGEGFPLIGYARESVVTTDKPAHIAVAVQ